ncbi:regucalcin-like [Pecten maximus]|uniref:regucalcin-like n=1 Tax=Pecten maximus TaxID=6579 RepID=UPI00145809BE|nr:regucalcin-like [Pecten maximus]XP_033737417.1 regucalcin-like [Pecten maximus]XP_033737418.1 regucalcin-like [Pecten maximus]
MSVSVAIPHVTTELGEGPHWEDDKQTLLFLDHVKCELFRWCPVTNELKSLKLGKSCVGAVVPCRRGGYLVGMERTLSHLDWDSGVTTVLQEIETVGTDDRFNDGKCDPAGRYWTGTMGARVNQAPGFELETSSLYSFDTAGKLVKHVDKISISNGMAWSSDNRTMFYIDSIPAKVEAFDYDISSGTISNRRDAVNFNLLPDKDTMGVPDGMTIDNDGHLWVACYNGGKVACFDPVTGTKLREVLIPAP